MIGWAIFLFLTNVIVVFFPFFSSQWREIIPISTIVLYVFLILVYWWYETKYFEKYYYDIRENFLVIKKGVFAPCETTLPYEKLQDVYLDQDLLDRAFNLWDLHVSTATGVSGREAHIDGVNLHNGETMKKMILEKIKEAKKT